MLPQFSYRLGRKKHMISLSEITGFEWDAGNERKSQDKHSISESEAKQVFFNMPLLLLDDVKHSQNELRFHAYGKTDYAKLLHITFTIRNDQIRVISARKMHKKEKEHYENNT